MIIILLFLHYLVILCLKKKYLLKYDEKIFFN